MRDASLRLVVSPRAIIAVLGGVAAFLVLAGIASVVVRVGLDHEQIHGLVPLFDLDVEGNIPTTYSATLLALCALTLSLIAAWRRQVGAPHAPAVAFLAGLMLAMALDEASQIHELMVEPLRSGLGLSGVLYYSWVLVYGAALVGLAIVYLPLLRGLSPPLRRRVLLALALYIGGALGLELPGGWVAESQGQEGGLFASLTILEETLELAGVLLLLHTLLACLASACGTIEVRFAGGAH